MPCRNYKNTTALPCISFHLVVAVAIIWVWVVKSHHATPQHVEILSYLDDGFLRNQNDPTTKKCLSHYVAPCSYRYAWRKPSKALSWTKCREEMSIDRFSKAMIFQLLVVIWPYKVHQLRESFTMRSKSSASPKRSRSLEAQSFGCMVEISSQVAQNIIAAQVSCTPFVVLNYIHFAISVEFTSSYRQTHPSFNIPTSNLAISKQNLCSSNNIARTLCLQGRRQHWQMLNQVPHQLLFIG